MKKLKRIITYGLTLTIPIALLVVLVLPVFAAPSTAGNTDENVALDTEAFHRTTFYANGRHWVFWCDNNLITYSSSADGITWEAESTIRAAETSLYFNTHFDGTYIYYSQCMSAVTNPITFRRGIPESDGTITWSAAEQIAVAAVGGVGYWESSLMVDSDGYPYITYTQWTGAGSVVITKSLTNDGTWVTDAGFPITVASRYGGGVSFPLSGSRWYTVYNEWNATYEIYGKLYDSGYGAEEDIDLTTNSELNVSAASNGESVYVVWQDANNDILFRERTTSWQGVVTLETPVADTRSRPQVSLINFGGDLIVNWQNQPDVDNVYYKKRISGVWDVARTAWFTDDMWGTGIAVTSLEAYSGIMSYAYQSDNTTPTSIKYNSSTLISPPTVSTLPETEIYIGGSTSALLQGNVASLGGDSEVTTWFEWGDDISYGNTASVEIVNATGNYTAVISGYEPLTTVVYRFVGQNIGGTTYGSPVTFTAQSNPSLAGSNIIKLLLRLILAATVLVGVVITGAKGGGVAMLVASVIGLMAFAIINAFINTLF